MKKRGLLVLMISSACLAEDWTWNYTKKLSVPEARSLATKKHYVFVKEDTPEFTQLVFSWNAHRPKDGHYTFYVQSRNSLTKQWTNDWIKMTDWGKDIQQSHCVKTHPGAQYFYVRLESVDGGKADAFKIKAECNGGATLANLRLLNVCISDMLKFAHEKINELENLKSIELKGISMISQFELGHDKQGSMCSPTSLTMLISYLAKKDFDPLEIAQQCYDNGLNAYGSWPFNTACAFEKCNNKYFKVRRLPSFRDLHGCLTRGIPVVVSIRGFLPTAPQEYPNGHLILVAGLKNKQVICYDPAFPTPDVRHEYNLQDFLHAWERSHRMAYVAEPIIIGQ